MRLPRIMLAPNGARKTRADHPRLPMTVAELIDETRQAVEAGADGLHAHVRDAQGRHSLDLGLYRELLAETDRAFPGLFVQVTTEAVGVHTAAEQRALVRGLMPRHVSIGLREILSDGEIAKTADLFAFCRDQGIDVQHILYDADDCRHFLHLRAQGVIPEGPAQILHVLGRYSEGQVSDPADVARRAAILAGCEVDWGLCAFGRHETACLIQAIRLGGKARIGFENNLHQPDGSIAESNAARVRDLVARL
ncbi:Uncharacterized conserved protein, DUF849 family [Paracoccus thiocyanatus]|uniref:Uncharacterized conserved protein, DUF849 family n=1 Tax=Paracoccus thiocyanatus TaxID=34006 RepID=A0A1N6P278_9RHOB|nr:3-keto-5-aminohexanoate cleavage protein [Paracoccus thiocyanatus]SIP98386.1 Uncharacterized conserved protein, DUF849 family [Paracoccus thiocyanatus]